MALQLAREAGGALPSVRAVHAVAGGSFETISSVLAALRERAASSEPPPAQASGPEPEPARARRPSHAQPQAQPPAEVLSKLDAIAEQVRQLQRQLAPLACEDAAGAMPAATIASPPVVVPPAAVPSPGGTSPAGTPPGVTSSVDVLAALSRQVAEMSRTLEAELGALRFGFRQMMEAIDTVRELGRHLRGADPNAGHHLGSELDAARLRQVRGELGAAHGRIRELEEALARARAAASPAPGRQPADRAPSTPGDPDAGLYE